MYTGVRGDGIQVDLLRIMHPKVDLGNPLSEEKDIEDALDLCGSKSHFREPKGFANVKPSGVELHSPINIRYAQDVPWLIFDQRELPGEEAQTGPVPGGGSQHIQCLVGPLEIVAIPPSIKLILAILPIQKVLMAKQLILEGAMQAFIFALGLRVIRAPVDDLNPQPYKPKGQASVISLPGGTIIHQHSLGQAILLENAFQLGLHLPGPFCMAGSKTHQEA